MKIGSDATVEMLRSWEGGTELPLSLSRSSIPKTISHIIQVSMEGQTDGRVLGGLTPLAISDNCPSRSTATG